MKRMWYSKLQARQASAAIRASGVDTEVSKRGEEEYPVAGLIRAAMHLAAKRGYDPLQVVRSAVEHWACDVSDAAEGHLDTEARATVKVIVQDYDVHRPGQTYAAGEHTIQYPARRRFS